MRKLNNTIRDYAWGSRTSMAELFGREGSGAPEAELWIGAHPGAPSRDATDGAGLDEVIAADPAKALGDEVARRYGRLPFLMKILAADAPLSLQVHPNLEQAREGFAREEREGPARDASDRNYKDDNHKPEMIVALTAFEALSGFRPTAEAARAFGWLADRLAEPDAQGLARTLAQALEAGDLAPAAALLLADDDVARRLAVLGARVVEQHPQDAVAADQSLGLLPRLAAFYPNDAGVLLALLLNLVSLAPGQALALPAGNVHAYLHGTGVEIMANSDNVLRGGMTSKHVDVDELLDIVLFDELEPAFVVPTQAAPGLEVYASGFDEFSLARLAGTTHSVTLPPAGPSAVVVLSGILRLRSEATGEELELARGESAYIEASEQPVTASGSTDLEAFVGYTPVP